MAARRRRKSRRPRGEWSICGGGTLESDPSGACHRPPRSGGPVFDGDSSNCRQVRILGNHHAIGQTASNGSNLHVDLLNATPCVPQVGKDSAVLFGGLSTVGPDGEPRKRMAQASQISVAACASFDARPKFAKDGNANADAMSHVALAIDASANVVEVVLKVLGDSGIQNVAAYHFASSRFICSICLPTASTLN
jgi:hypothetical protein